MPEAHKVAEDLSATLDGPLPRKHDSASERGVKRKTRMLNKYSISRTQLISLLVIHRLSDKNGAIRGGGDRLFE